MQYGLKFDVDSVWLPAISVRFNSVSDLLKYLEGNDDSFQIPSLVPATKK